jgi:hypothetical protein
MSCEFVNRDQRIDDFLLGKLSPAEAEAFEIHIFGCAECLDELRLREQMIALIKEERVTAIADYPPQRLPKQRPRLIKPIVNFLRFRPNIWIYAGTAAVLLIGFFIIPLLRRQETPNTFTANFIEAPALESKFGQALRSSEFSLTIIVPQIGENFIGDIEFRWEIRKDEQAFSGPLVLKILNNREASAHTATVENGQYICKEKLAPGVYYWTLEEQGETLYLGKFFVKKSQK